MARLARVKAEVESGAFYHLCGRTAGPIGDYPLDDKRVRREIVAFLKLFARVFCCDVLGFCVMGNHYHLVVRMHPARRMKRAELRERASLLYPAKLLDGWLAAKWERFEARIFDVSELMRSLQSAVARWFNAAHARRGRFWAERFKSVLLEGEKAAFDCLVYVELNPVRAGIVARPEAFAGGSLHYREVGDDAWMAPLTEITGQVKRGQALRDYKACVYYRGSVGTKERHAEISKRLLAEEEVRGFAVRGAFTRRLRHFTDGVVMGTEDFVRAKLEEIRGRGQYLRRKNPVKPEESALVVLRPQRA